MAGRIPGHRSRRLEARRASLRPLRLVVLVLSAALALVALGWSAPGLSMALADTQTGTDKVAVFEDARVPAGEVWDDVVVVGGDLVVEGTVRNSVVVVGGDVTIAGEGRVGTARSPEDTALVSVFGRVSLLGGGSVVGQTVDVGAPPRVHLGMAGGSVVRTWQPGSILSWVWSTIFLVIVALVAAAVAPRQLAVVGERVRRHFFSSLGWGALGAIVVVPIVSVLLVITIVGILALVPWLLVGLPLLSLFGLAAVGVFVGRLLIRDTSDRRGAVMLTAVLGVVIIGLARWIPVAGVIILGLLWLAGFGATYVAIWVWLRNRHRERRERDQAVRDWAAYGGPPASGPLGPPPGWGGPGDI